MRLHLVVWIRDRHINSNLKLPTKLRSSSKGTPYCKNPFVYLHRITTTFPIAKRTVKERRDNKKEHNPLLRLMRKSI